MQNATELTLEQEHNRPRAVIGVVRRDGEGPGGVVHHHRLPHLHLHELPPLKPGKVAEGEVEGEPRRVDGAGAFPGVGGGDEVVPVRVGEEAVAAAAGGGAPRVDGEGEPPRHLYRHPPENFPKLQFSPPLP